MGIGNTAANISGILAPIAVSMITTDVLQYFPCTNKFRTIQCLSFRQGTQEQWRTVFFISAGMYLFTWLAYIIVVKGSVVSWAKPPEPDFSLEVQLHVQCSVHVHIFRVISNDMVKQVLGKSDNQADNEETSHDNKAFEVSTNL